jgi:CrcB protein
LTASQEAQPGAAEVAQRAAARKPASKWQRIREPVLLYLVVMAGSVIGGVLRAAASMLSLAWLGAGFPFGTLFVNIAGSFAIGFFATLTGPDGRVFAGMHLRQFVMTGICGGFTTFSVFSLETFRLAQSGELRLAAINIGISVVAWLAFVWIGHAAAARINRIGG